MIPEDDLLHRHDCPFCRYAEAQDQAHPFHSGSNTTVAVVDNRAIYYSPTRAAMWFTPINPITEGHLLFVPTWHARHGETPAITAAIGALYDCAAAWKPQAFNIITSWGAAATQTVDHLHAHYIPRKEGDGVVLPWTTKEHETP